MTPQEMAALHADAFGDTGRAWSANEIKALLKSPGVFSVSESAAFALGRVVADEAELLTIATRPTARRQGHGMRCLKAFEAAARARGARSAFLEVGEDNPAAIALYQGAGYEHVGRRSAYYTRGDGKRVAALILRREIA